MKHDQQRTQARDLAKALKTPALNRVLAHHASHCTYFVFSGDRHCSCGRDQAITELTQLLQIAAGTISKAFITKGHYGNVQS